MENGSYRTVETRVDQGRYRVEGTATVTDNGVVLTIVGGERSHVGAVALSTPTPSHVDEDKTSVTSSVLTLLGHKEDLLAKPAAEKLARCLNLPTVVVAGIHIDNATVPEIERLTKNSELVVKKLLEKIEKKEFNT